MTIIFAVFMLGLFVTLVVAKGILQAQEFAKQELDKQDSAPPAEDGDPKFN